MQNLKHKVFSRLDYFLAFGFGSGLMKTAPGTWGTAAAIPIFLLLSHLSTISYLTIVSGLFFLGIWICDKVSRDLKIHDFSGIVWDEIVGFLFTMTAIKPSILNITIGFSLFRVFDIFKPYPISIIDRKIHGGFGIMLDDLAAAIPAYILIGVFNRMF
jgi:phosphatidylglycerophosphatase A